MKELSTELEQIFNKDDYDKWIELLHESNIINKCYVDFYSDESYLKTSQIEQKYELAAFLMILEKNLYYNKNIIIGKEDENEKLNFKFNINFAFETIGNKNQVYGKLFDRTASIADQVIKFLLFFKKGTSTIFYEEIDQTVVDSAFLHLTNIDKKEVLDSIVKQWQFSARSILISNETHVQSKINNNFLKDYFISKERIEARREILINNISYKYKMESKFKNNYNSIDDELKVKEYLKEIIGGYSDSYSCKIGNQSFRIGDLIRMYIILQKITLEFVKYKQKINSRSLNKVCYIISREELKKQLLSNKLEKEIIDKLIDIFMYNKNKDIFDTPLIYDGNNFIIIPSIILNTDVSQVCLSIVDHFSFRGELFENEILSLLKENNINAYTQKYKDDEGEYQCDLLFVVGRDLFICECKAWGTPKTIQGFYNQLHKCYSAKKQLDRIANKYISQKEWLKNKLDFQDEFRSINKLVITSHPIGVRNKIEQTYFIDYSALYLFIQRKKPSMNIQVETKIIKYRHPAYNEYDGKVTFNKLINFLNNPAPIDLSLRNMKKSQRMLPLNQMKIEFDEYEKEVLYTSDLKFILDGGLNKIKQIFNF